VISSIALALVSAISLWFEPLAVARFPYSEVIVFVDADRADSVTLRRRMELVNEVGQFYNTRTMGGNFRLTILPIGDQSRSVTPLFEGQRRFYNSEGDFNLRVFHQQYMRSIAGTHNRDVLGTAHLLANILSNRRGGRILAIYVSDMVHVTPEVDTSWRGTADINYEEFKADYRSLVGPAGAFARGGARLDVLVQRIGRTPRADPLLSEFWETAIFDQHLRANRVIRAGGSSLTTLLSRLR
jgi:hypothetical protein